MSLRAANRDMALLSQEAGSPEVNVRQREALSGVVSLWAELEEWGVKGKR